MFEERLLEDNYQALAHYQEMKPQERAALDAAERLARRFGANWLPPQYRWLEEQWRA
jgi:hypothetical protein